MARRIIKSSHLYVPMMPISTIDALSKRIAKTDASSTQDNLEILSALENLRSEVGQYQSNVTLEGLDGAILMLKFHVRTEGMGGPELMDVLRRIVNYVHLCMLQGAEVASTHSAVRLGDPTNIDPVAMVDDMQLGQILLSMGYVTEDEINQGLAFGKDRAMPIGEALMENKSVGESQVREALCYQAACRRAALGQKAGPVELPQRSANEGLRVIRMPASAGLDEGPGLKLMADVMLGEVLMRNGHIDQKQLDMALLCQRVTGVRLGEALVEGGACNWNQLEAALECQSRLRGGA